MGYAMGNMRTRKNLTSHSVLAPISSPWREHAACGTISPRTTMSMVEMIPPSTPEVRSAMEMAISAALGHPPHTLYPSIYPPSTAEATGERGCEGCGERGCASIVMIKERQHSGIVH
jgi:hypothetical protein